MREPLQALHEPPPPRAVWEWGIVALAACTALALGFAHLGGPSLWHDECFQVFLAKNLVDKGVPALPSGKVLYSGIPFNGLMAAFIALFGDREAVVRAPSVLLGGLNIVLVFLVIRPLLGRAAALVAALALALSPWHVAWTREARFYEMQTTFYLLTLMAIWRYGTASTPRAMVGWLCAGAAAYALGALTVLHSVLFLAPVGLFAGLMVIAERRVKSRWGLLCVVVALGLAMTLGIYLTALDKVYAHTIWKDSGIGGKQVDRLRTDPIYYLRFLWLNHSRGVFLVAMAGFAMMLVRERRKGLYAALAFWVPVLILNYFFGYRRFRFMYFAFPFFMAAFAYGLVRLCAFLTTVRQNRWRMALGAVVVVLLAGTALSAVRLVGDSLHAASGANTTLERRHPQWRKPCTYVKNHLDDAVVVTTTYLPTLYYVGRVDSWFPERFMPFEIQESGFHGIEDLDALKAYVAAHPKGYFIAEWWRYWRNSTWPGVESELAWMDEHFTLINEACSEDVRVYAWGFAPQTAQ